jgi:hypothetical protein
MIKNNMNNDNNNRTVLVAILMVLVFAVAFFIGRVTADQNIGNFSESEMESSDNVENTSGEAGNASSNMTEGQRKMLSSMGINPDQVNITPQMIACAEAKLGATRTEEIKNGATPTFSEGASLVACYK